MVIISAKFGTNNTFRAPQLLLITNHCVTMNQSCLYNLQVMRNLTMCPNDFASTKVATQAKPRSTGIFHKCLPSDYNYGCIVEQYLAYDWSTLQNIIREVLQQVCKYPLCRLFLYYFIFFSVEYRFYRMFDRSSFVDKQNIGYLKIFRHFNQATKLQKEVMASEGERF